MNCPNCCSRLNVVDSRAAANNTTKRRLVCETCGCRYTSYESIKDDNTEPTENKTTTATKTPPANKIDMSSVFKTIAENAITQHEYISIITGGVYVSRDDAIAESIKELERLYKMSQNTKEV